MRSPVDRLEEAPGGATAVDSGAEDQRRVSSDYVAAVFKSATWTPAIDAGGAGNETRFINDFRGNEQGRANCCFSQTYIAGRPALMVVVTQDVHEGEELLVDYGEAFWKAS